MSLVDHWEADVVVQTNVVVVTLDADVAVLAVVLERRRRGEGKTKGVNKKSLKIERGKRPTGPQLFRMTQ